MDLLEQVPYEMLGNVVVSYCWRPQTVRAALIDFVTFIVQSYFNTPLRYVLLQYYVEQLGFWRLWTKRHSWRAGEVIRCVYIYTVTVQNTWSICQAAVHKSLAYSLIAIPHPHARLLFPSGASWPIGNIRTPRKRVETIFVGSWASPLVCFHCTLHSFLHLLFPQAPMLREAKL